MEGETERYSNGITKQIGMNEKKEVANCCRYTGEKPFLGLFGSEET